MPPKRNEKNRRTYFHCAPMALAPGSIIQPGNWGRVMKLYEPVSGQIQLNTMREALLELSRQIHAPSQPSRLKCVFALPTLQEAIAFRNKHARTSIIYEVEPVIDAPNSHVGDYEAAMQAFVGRYFLQMFQFPMDYWTRTSPQFTEVLLECAVRVIAVPAVPPV